MDEKINLYDIFNDDPFDLLNDKNGIHQLKHVQSADAMRSGTDFVARRQVFEDFNDYELIFKQCQQDLKTGNRRLVKFAEENLKEGSFFVMNGMMGYLDKIHHLERDKNSKRDGRTTVIFENGTYSNMLFRSLGKGLYDNGYLVSERIDQSLYDLEKHTMPDDNDQQNGMIYVLSSLSEDEKISTKKNLYKIGFTTEKVEDRIRKAPQDRTFLMAPVKIEMSFTVYNINPQKLEKLIHKFFGRTRLDVIIYDKNHQPYRPNEWFIAPINIIQEAINLIISGAIIHYQYDDEREEIVLR